MAYISVYIKLTIAGISTGPFDLYSDVNNFTDPFEEGVTRESLVDGYTSNLVPEGATQIKVQSLGACTNYIIIDIAVPTTSTTSTSTTSTSTSTSTSTTTTTTTAALLYQISMCYLESLHLAEKTEVFEIGDIVQFDTIPSGGNPLPYCGTIVADDAVGVADATIESAVTRSCDDDIHCHQGDAPATTTTTTTSA